MNVAKLAPTAKKIDVTGLKTGSRKAVQYRWGSPNRTSRLTAKTKAWKTKITRFTTVIPKLQESYKIKIQRVTAQVNVLLLWPESLKSEYTEHEKVKKKKKRLF